MSSTNGGQQAASAGPLFGSTGLQSSDRYQLGRTDLERGLPHAMGREEHRQRAETPQLGRFFAIG